MTLLSPPHLQNHIKAPTFTLPDAWGRSHSLDTLKGKNATLVMFICHHCPYVLALITPLVAQAHTLQKDYGVGIIAIMSNDGTTYPEDAFENMAPFAEKHHFNFPYLFDESQNVARSFEAVCTPDFFGFDNHLLLKYRGQFNSTRPSHTPSPSQHPSSQHQDLFEAMVALSKGHIPPREQVPSIGCSIKWKTT